MATKELQTVPNTCNSLYTSAKGLAIFSKYQQVWINNMQEATYFLKTMLDLHYSALLGVIETFQKL